MNVLLTSTVSEVPGIDVFNFDRNEQEHMFKCLISQYFTIMSFCTVLQSVLKRLTFLVKGEDTFKDPSCSSTTLHVPMTSAIQQY